MIRSLSKGKALLIAFALLALRAPSSAAQSPQDTVAGTVNLPAGKPAPAAEVTITPVGSTRSSTVRTDSSGRFETLVPRGIRYLIFVRAGDGSTARMSADRSPSGRTRISMTLEPVRTLPTVSVKSRRAPTDSRLAPAFGQSETEVTLVGGDLAASEQGTVASALELVAGALSTSGGTGFSVLGLGAEQNRIRFNGTPVQSLSLPRLTPVVARLNVSPHDVSKGGFSGGLLTIEPRSASNFITTNIGVSGQPRILRGNEGAAGLRGRDESAFHVDFAHTAPIRWDKTAFTVSGQVGRRDRPLSSLTSASQSMLSELGISNTGRAQIISAMTSAGVPSALSVDSHSSSTDEASFLARLDFTPAEPRRMSVTGTGSYSRINVLGMSPTSSATNAFASRSWQQTLQVDDERTFQKAMLNNFRVGYSASGYSSTPYLDLPSGQVLISSDETAEPSVPASFGGPLLRDARDQRVNVGLSNTTSWYSRGGNHLWNASVEGQAERIRNRVAGATLGQYSFLNADDVASNHARSFSRQFGQSIANANFVSLGGSIGDTWERESGFSFQYGMRMDAFRANPEFTDDRANSLFRSFVSHSPQWELGFSPRFGFTRTFAVNQPSAGSAARRVVVSGGTGVFRSADADPVLASLQKAGWRSSSSARLFCYGDGVPQPDWRAFATSAHFIPTKCLGSSSELRKDSSATIAALDKDFHSPSSWRTNLAATTRLGSVRLGLEGILSVNKSQADLRDINQIRTPRFNLPDEANRPVFVKAEAIDESGVFSTASNRFDPFYGSVWLIGSGMRSLSRQFALSLQSVSPTILARRSWQVSYVQSRVTEKRRGFDGSTIDDPSTVETAAGQFESRHQFVLRASSVFGASDQLEFSGYVRVNSGLHFTPLVASDINGDGLVNDRPYVFPPGDAARIGIDQLINNAPSYVRRCLSSQLGGFAGAQSCTGPWSVSSTLNLRLRGDVVHLPMRSRLTISVVNPISLTDRLLHGTDIHGWGQRPFVDPYLYSVNGFDRNANRFRYSVNPKFGSTSSARSIATNPFRLSLSVFIPIGPTWGAQTVETDLAPGRWRAGSRKSADMLTDEHIMTVIGFDPVSRIGQGRDSASYSQAQRQTIREAISSRDSALRAIFREVALTGAQIGDRPTNAEKKKLLHMREVATDSAIIVLVQTGDTILNALTPDQIDRLSPTTRMFLTRADIQYLRRLEGFIY